MRRPRSACMEVRSIAPPTCASSACRQLPRAASSLQPPAPCSLLPAAHILIPAAHIRSLFHTHLSCNPLHTVHDFHEAVKLRRREEARCFFDLTPRVGIRLEVASAALEYGPYIALHIRRTDHYAVEVGVQVRACTFYLTTSLPPCLPASLPPYLPTSLLPYLPTSLLPHFLLPVTLVRRRLRNAEHGR